MWNVPYRRNLFFTGREDLLAQLHERLGATGAAALTQPQTHAISGLGGIGKTQIAIEYAYRYRDDYRFVLWVSATPEGLLTDVVKLAVLLGLPEQQEQDQAITVAAVQRWLATHPHWLLILDNADDLEVVRDFLPAESPGHVLLTTREQAAGSLAQPISVERMDQLEGTLLLLRRARVLAPGAVLEQAPAAERVSAAAIVAELDGLPLAIDQAGAYIEETGCALADYLALYRTRRKDLLGRRGRLVTDHPGSVAATFSLSFQRVEEANVAAADLLRLCAFLAPDAIPEAILGAGAIPLGSALGQVAAEPFKLNEALEVVRRYSLLQRQSGTKTLSMHHLAQAVLVDSMSEEEQQQWAERAIKAVEAAFPAVEQGHLVACDPYLPHIQACVTLVDTYQLAFPEAASLLHQLGMYLYYRARYPEAEPLYQRALRIKEANLGPEHPSTGTTLHELARLYQAQGKYPEAEPLYHCAHVA